MENAIMLQNVSLEKLETLIARVVKMQLEEFYESQPTNAKEVLLTREEACTFLKINKTSLWKWTKNGKLKAYGLGNRVYYKRAELLESVKKIN